jgi:hypothetical protein
MHEPTPEILKEQNAEYQTLLKKYQATSTEEEFMKFPTFTFTGINLSSVYILDYALIRSYN